MKHILIVLCIATILSIPLVHAKQDAYPKAFKNNEKVCFVGDSITAGGYYIGELILFYTTRFPDLNIDFRNVGISGDTCGGILWRMNSDILSNSAQVYTLMIGMNDVQRSLYPLKGDALNVESQKVLKIRDTYKKNMKKIIDALSKDSRILIVFTPSIYDQTALLKVKNDFGVADELKTYGDIAIEIAKEKSNTRSVDMWTATHSANAKYQANEGSEKTIIGADRVHPRKLGGLVMATQFIRKFDECGFVSDFSIDARNGKIQRQFNCDVSNIKSSPNKVSFTLLEYSLPFPFTDLKMDAYFDFIKDYNKEILTVKNLKAGKYTLKIDGKKVSEYSSEEFENGINLALNKNTPQFAQSLKVEKLCENFSSCATKNRNYFLPELFSRDKIGDKTGDERTGIINNIYQKLRVRKNPPANPFVVEQYRKYVETLDKREVFLRDAVNFLKEARAAAKTTPHLFEIEPL